MSYPRIDCLRIFRTMDEKEQILEERSIVKAAIQFINSTASHIFLTGKAGTGKTTFLKNLASRTHKQLAIIAPTGIAALNAGGVTIHSQFLLPFGMFVPDPRAILDPSQGVNAYNARLLANKHPLNSMRKQVLRAIDLLVIDEVSMLRADLLDAIDARMKAVRGNYSQSFGGVQLLLIGDLYQLPPVVKRQDDAILRRYYNSPWFFESHALKQDGFVYIELDKIFRQHDSTFIDLLNNLRNNSPTPADIAELNKHYKTPEEILQMKDVITLTTHNYKADELNNNALAQLDSPLRTIHANIEGDFPESMYPVLEKLQLKLGAQIMFTKNDSEDRMYFNGKLATVVSIEGDEITVRMAGSDVLYTLRKAIWENKRYTVDTETQDIEEEMIGTFEQYPIKLAWAITVHKSQGLTFDAAIIDVGQAFADGQVYVALSRLRSLNGLIMRTRIDPDVISTDRHIVNFTQSNNRPDELPELMREKQMDYLKQLVIKTFDFDLLEKECVSHGANEIKIEEDQSGERKTLAEHLRQSLTSERENTNKFRRQLFQLLESKDNVQFLIRLEKGCQYYRNLLMQGIALIIAHTEELRNRKRIKAYLTSLSDLDQLYSKKMEELDVTFHMAECILHQRYDFDFATLRHQRTMVRSKMLEEIRERVEKTLPSKGKSKKKTKSGKRKSDVSTSEITLGMFESGMAIEEIASERGFVVSTIEGHLAKAVEAGRLSIFRFIDKDQVDIIEAAVRSLPEEFSSKDLWTALEGKFSYGQLRAVLSHMKINAESQTNEL